MTAKPQPRSVVLARAWQRIPGVAVLSSADGGPLTRTVKKIIDPLVVRTAARPRLGRPLLDEDAAAELIELLRGRASARLGPPAARGLRRPRPGHPGNLRARHP